MRGIPTKNRQTTGSARAGWVCRLDDVIESPRNLSCFHCRTTSSSTVPVTQQHQHQHQTNRRPKQFFFFLSSILPVVRHVYHHIPDRIVARLVQLVLLQLERVYMFVLFILKTCFHGRNDYMHCYYDGYSDHSSPVHHIIIMTNYNDSRIRMYNRYH